MPDTLPVMADSVPLDPQSVRHRVGTVSVMPPECCPPSLRNSVRHGPAHAMVEAERSGTVPVAATNALESRHHFVPIPLGASSTEAVIRIELQRGSGTVVIQWPASAAAECVALLRELMA